MSFAIALNRDRKRLAIEIADGDCDAHQDCDPPAQQCRRPRFLGCDWKEQLPADSHQALTTGVHTCIAVCCRFDHA